MKKLFKVGKEFFDNKMKAKAERGENGTISRGPDHIGKHGNRNPKRLNKPGTLI